MHLTGSVFIDDDESGIHHHYGAWFEKITLHEPVSRYRPNDMGRDNTEVGITRQIVGARGHSCGNRRPAGHLQLGSDLLRGFWRVEARFDQP